MINYIDNNICVLFDGISQFAIIVTMSTPWIVKINHNIYI